MKINCFILVVTMLFFAEQAANAQVPTPVACYNFSGNLNEANGGTPLTPINGLGTYVVGPTFCGVDSMYHWDLTQGLNLVIGSAFSLTNYTIEMLFKFESPYPRSWQRIIDFKNNTIDQGFYTINNNVQMYPSYTGTSNMAPPDTWFRLFFTRDSTNNVLGIYINNNLELTFTDNGNFGTFISNLILFKDDIQVQNEEAAGMIDYLRIYNQPLTYAQIQEIVNNSNIAPIITLSSPADTIICNGQSVTLSVSGASDYLWNTGETTPSITVTPSVTTTYSVVGKNYILCSKTCQSDSVATIVSIQPAPTVTVTGNAPICVGDSLLLTASGATNYSWSPPTGLSNTAGAAVKAIPTSNITYTVTGAINGCSDSMQTPVIVNPLPELTTNLTTACAGQTVTLTATGGTSYTWSAGTTVTGATTATANPIVNSIYTVTSTGSSCSDTTQVLVESPQANFEITLGECSVAYTNISTLAKSYQWDFGDGIISTDETPNHSYATSGEYIVELTAISNIGCLDSTSIPIQAEGQESTLFVPNSFSPNGDGINDSFKVGSTDLLEFDAKIFNRWGEKIHSWNDPTEGWDGTVKGAIVSDGAYTYIIKARSTCGNVDYEYRGVIVVVR